MCRLVTTVLKSVRCIQWGRRYCGLWHISAKGFSHVWQFVTEGKDGVKFGREVWHIYRPIITKFVADVWCLWQLKLNNLSSVKTLNTSVKLVQESRGFSTVDNTAAICWLSSCRNVSSQVKKCFVYFHPGKKYRLFTGAKILQFV